MSALALAVRIAVTENLKKIPNHMKQKTIVPALPFLLPSLFGVGVFYAVPFAVSVFFTFTQGVAHPHFAGLQNFRELWGTAVFRQALGNTVLFLTVGLCLLLALALFAALVCAKGRFAPQELALLLPMVIPVNSFALGWQSLWGQNGAVNRLLGLAGREPVDFLNGAAAFPLLVALYLIKNTGCVSLILAAVIRAVPQDYQDAYQLDSTSEWGYVRRVLLPLLTPTLLIGMLLGISNYFLMFRDVYALYGSNPPARLYMLQHFMNGNFYQLNHQLLSAAALATVLLITGTVWFGKRCTVEKTENGKGRQHNAEKQRSMSCTVQPGRLQEFPVNGRHELCHHEYAERLKSVRPDNSPRGIQQTKGVQRQILRYDRCLEWHQHQQNIESQQKIPSGEGKLAESIPRQNADGQGNRKGGCRVGSTVPEPDVERPLVQKNVLILCQADGSANAKRICQQKDHRQ